MTLVEPASSPRTATHVRSSLCAVQARCRGHQEKRRANRPVCVRHRSLPRGAGRSARGLGLGPGLDGRRVVRGVLHRLRIRYHRRIPPAPHPRIVQGQSAAAHRVGRCGKPGYRRPSDPLGGRPPPSSRVQRSGGRSPFPVALWELHTGADERFLLRPRWVAVRCRTHQSREFAPDLLRDRDIVRVDRLFVLWTAVSVLRADAARRPDHLVLGRRVCRHCSGPRWCASSSCTTSPGRSTRCVTRSASGRSPPRDKSSNFWPLAVISFGESWHNTHHADPTARSARGATWPARRVRPSDLDIREAGLGDAMFGGRGPSGWPGCGPERPLGQTDAAVVSHHAPLGSGSRTMSPGGGRTRVRMTGKERREQLLDVGRSLFAEKGFEATSIEEIAARAGVSKPVVYEHFGGKEGLYAVVVGSGDGGAALADHLSVDRGSCAGAGGASRPRIAHLHRRGHGRISGLDQGLAGGLRRGNVFLIAERHCQPGRAHLGPGVQPARPANQSSPACTRKCSLAWWR